MNWKALVKWPGPSAKSGLMIDARKYKPAPPLSEEQKREIGFIVGYTDETIFIGCLVTDSSIEVPWSMLDQLDENLRMVRAIRRASAES